MLRRCLLILLNLVLVILVHGTLVHDAHAGAEGFLYGEGNAAGPARTEVQALLERFAAGYAAREVPRAEAFVNELFVKQDPLVLGTMPREIFRGTRRVQHLVATDWQDWGDCRFRMDRAHVSVQGDVAWIAARGHVRFDLSRFLVVPLRLTATALRLPDGWRFQQMQFQFDVDLTRSLGTLLLLLAWLALNLGLLAREALRTRSAARP